MFHHLTCAQGNGEYPAVDPWGVEFSATYTPERQKVANTRIMGPWHACLDGVQGDADFIAHLFHLKRRFDYGKTHCVVW